MAKLLVAEPALLALPALGLGEAVRASGEREARALSAALPSVGRGFNLFGTHDIRGRGTHVESSPHCDPFIMCVAATVGAGQRLPFCAHPHCGASVATILLQGAAIRPWDNVHGDEPEPLLPGGVYHVDTGAGCVHDEPLEPIDARARTRAGFSPDELPAVPCADPRADTRLVQLWWNALAADAPPRGVRTQVLAPADVPRVTQDDGIAVRVLAGSYRGCADALAPSSRHPVLVLHVRLPPGGAGALSPLPADFNGFVWQLSGAAEVGGHIDAPPPGCARWGERPSSPRAAPAVALSAGARGLAILPPGGDALRLANGAADAPVELLVALGRPHRAPYFKYVGYGGALIHRSVGEVEAAMCEYEKSPADFGRAAAGADAAPVDVGARYTLVPGFQADGGEMMERPADVVARFSRVDPAAGTAAWQ
ncbi:hypothetical protein KFE25_012688 [Diacronema lutheri]|uniref:Pirin n=1 Tax=Diacronema lutheri TaxID=2081491 RepID=A0A8J5X623_DIALT|nr:hypothetical protein KFE25_012688 [Diacronema lutheri]